LIIGLVVTTFCQVMQVFSGKSDIKGKIPFIEIGLNFKQNNGIAIKISSCTSI